MYKSYLDEDFDEDDEGNQVCFCENAVKEIHYKVKVS